VMSNSDFMGMLSGAGGRGDMHVTVNGSGLTQEQLSQAIYDAFERFSRFDLPNRVAEINGDPLARG